MIATTLFFVAALFLVAMGLVMVVRDGAKISAALAGNSPIANGRDAPVQVTLRWVRPRASEIIAPEWRAAA